MATWKSWQLTGDDFENQPEGVDGENNTQDAPGAGPDHGPGAGPSHSVQSDQGNAALQADAATMGALTVERFKECATRLALEAQEEKHSVTMGKKGMFLTFSIPKKNALFTEGVCRVPIHSDNPTDQAIFATNDPVPSTFDLQQVANQWNRHYLQPSVVFIERRGQKVFLLQTRFFIQAGITDHQLDQMVTRALTVSAQAITKLPAMLTPTVTATSD